MGVIMVPCTLLRHPFKKGFIVVVQLLFIESCFKTANETNKRGSVRFLAGGQFSASARSPRLTAASACDLPSVATRGRGCDGTVKIRVTLSSLIGSQAQKVEESNVIRV